MVRLLVAAVGVAGSTAAMALYSAEPPAIPDRYSPDAILELVAADLAANSLPRTTRYLSLDDLPDEKSREGWQTIMNGHLQTLSGEPGIALPVRVGPLLRLDSLDYGETFAAQWERLGKQEPFWHGEDIVVEDQYEEQEFGHYFDAAGNTYGEPGPGRTWKTTETRKVKVPAGKAVRRFFVRTPKGKAALEAITLKTRGTDVPVVRATWFHAQTAIQWQRDPGYYDFIGVKDLASFEKVIGFIRKGQSKGFLRDLRAATGRSGVTTPDTLRRIVRFQAPGGGYWFTQDSDQRLAKDKAKSNPASNLGDNYEHQAVEGIGFGANNFPKTFLGDQAGVRQDRAPDNIAGDRTGGVHNDYRIHINLSCTRCHRNGYLQEVDDWIRNIYNADGLLGTKLGPDEYQRLRLRSTSSRT